MPVTMPMVAPAARSEEHTSELQSLMRISYAVFCLKKKIAGQASLRAPDSTLPRAPAEACPGIGFRDGHSGFLLLNVLRCENMPRTEYNTSHIQAIIRNSDHA